MSNRRTIVIGALLVAAGLSPQVFPPGAWLSAAQRIVIDRTKFHDELFNEGRTGLIDRRLSGTRGDLDLPDIFPSDRGIYLPDPDQMLSSLACNSNVIMVGNPRSSESRMTAEAGNVYTIWRIRNNETLRKSGARQTPDGSTVDVLVRGGAIHYGGRKITAKNPAVANLTREVDYVLFLLLIPETGAFRLWQGFDVSGATVKPIGEGTVFPNLEKLSTEEFLLKLRSAVPLQAGAAGCAREN